MERRFARKWEHKGFGKEKGKEWRVVTWHWTWKGRSLKIILGGWERIRWYDDWSNEVPVIWEEAPEFIIHNGEDEARRAEILDVEGNYHHELEVLDGGPFSWPAQGPWATASAAPRKTCVRDFNFISSF